MKAKRILVVGVAAMIILEVVLIRFIRLLKGEQIIDFLARVGGLNDISLMGLLNIALVAFLSFFKGVRLQHCVGSNVALNGHVRNQSILSDSSEDLITIHLGDQRSRKQAA